MYQMVIYNYSIIPILLLLLTSNLAVAQQSPPGADPDGFYKGGKFSPSMGVIIIVLIAALFFMGFFSIYIRHCSDSSSTHGTVVGRGIGSIRRSRRAPRGLDPEVIESFPTFDYAAVKSAKFGKGALECAVCLTEFEDDDVLRLIPKCDHVFHPDCIDAWLVGHTTCPVCRCNLADATDNRDDQVQVNRNDVVVEVVDEVRVEDHNENNNEGNESMEQPLHGRMGRSRTMRNLSFGRPRWLGRFARSFSTGHVAVKQWEDMERFTLRLPAEVRKQIVSGKLERTTSLLVLPRETSSRRGYRTGFSEGSSKGRFGSVRSDLPVLGRSDRWVFSLTPPFFTRAPSVKSPRVVGTTSTTPTSRGGSLRGSVRENVTTTTTTTSREGSLRGAMQAELTQLPV
ncbi:E3 ubiquitin-protein ligase ATL31-like [Chenopodium quinoa]|uniref:RING-type E3 ubiquitin transferase n=1 Tax=Chenopodium quinoa TaxID=63459 RepID=A0A803KPB7_CHEQI|nr:E3 ubiquitin-protein ligase ATL31-like [Chenopodium quinoa]